MTENDVKASVAGFPEAVEEIFSESPEARELWNRTSPARAIAAAFTVLRFEAGLTQTQLAERAGWDKSFVSRLEAGTGGYPDSKTISRYAAACGVEVGLVFASLKSEGIGHIHAALNISGASGSEIFDRVAGQELPLAAVDEDAGRRR